MKTDPAEVKLGQLLFYDPILSGNKTVSCATCHHPNMATGDGLSLGIGDGGIGFGTERKIDPDNQPEQRIPRHAQTLFNLGALEFTRFFHDGRLEADPARPSGLRTPLEDDMVVGFDNALSAQTMFPVLSPDEMAGHYNENDVSRAVRQGLITSENGAWQIIAHRISAIPEYRAHFDAVIGADQPISFTSISNAIAAFIAFEWRADDSPYDRFLQGEAGLTTSEIAGMDLFYGKAGCHNCHSGTFQTDHNFHAIAVPQIGPGKAGRFESHQRDVGRMRVTGRADDAYKFRTPSLRNVAQTAPYGHSGAFASLEGVIRHHLDPVASLKAYSLDEAILPDFPKANDQWVAQRDAEIEAISAASELDPQSLDDADIKDLVAFLGALTDKTSLAGRLGVPKTVPSGLPVDQ